MTRKPADYEAIVARLADSIYRAVENPSDVEVRHGSKNRWPGQSGYRHQIDVSVANPSNVLVVECKDWSRPISVDHVLTFAARLGDISASDLREVNAVMATRSGLQKGADTVATYFGI